MALAILAVAILLAYIFADTDGNQIAMRRRSRRSRREMMIAEKHRYHKSKSDRGDGMAGDDELRDEIKRISEAQAEMRAEMRQFFAEHKANMQRINERLEAHSVALFGRDNDGRGLTYRMQAVEARMGLVWAGIGMSATVAVEMIARRLIH